MICLDNCTECDSVYLVDTDGDYLKMSENFEGDWNICTLGCAERLKLSNFIFFLQLTYM